MATIMRKKKNNETARRLAGAASQRRAPLAPLIKSQTDRSNAGGTVKKVIAPGKRWKATSVSGLVGEPSREAKQRAERSSKALQESEEGARRESPMLGRH
jgi:hypothetical protein